jgi:hypothetical protein
MILCWDETTRGATGSITARTSPLPQFSAEKPVRGEQVCGIRQAQGVSAGGYLVPLALSKPHLKGLSAVASVSRLCAHGNFSSSVALRSFHVQ